MAHLWPLLIAAAVFWLVFRFVRSQFRSLEPVEGSSPNAPPRGVPSPKKNAPRGRAGAVALAEPDGMKITTSLHD